MNTENKQTYSQPHVSAPKVTIVTSSLGVQA